MPVKIDNSSNSLPLSPAGKGKVRASVSGSGNNTPAAATGDSSANLGASTAQFRSLGSSVDNTSPVNASKVAEIKQAISEGRFQVNSGAVADSLIQSVTDLISSQKA